MDAALRHLIRVSRTVGADTSLVQGGGGNTSVKTGGGRHIYIKASGTALKDMDEQRGWRRLRSDSVLAILEDESLGSLPAGKREGQIMARLLLSCEDDMPETARPSVESHLHALLGRCVVHLHPTAVASFVCARDGRAELERVFAEDALPPLWVPYADPGYKLALKIRRLVGDYTERHGQMPRLLFLQKHGLLVSARTPDEALEEVRRVASACARRLAPRRRASLQRSARDDVARVKLAVRKAYFDVLGQRAEVRHFADAEIAGFLAGRNARKLTSVPALTPDEFAYAGGPPLWLERPESDAIAAGLKRQIDREGRVSSSFLVPKMGLFVVGPEKVAQAVKDIASGSLAVRSAAHKFGGPVGLTRRQRDFIAEWEMEGYRRAVAAACPEGDLAGRIAVVTGAGSGLGRSIAVGMARAGTAVALADIELPAAKEAAALIQAEIPGASCAPIACDVTNERRVDDSFAQVLDRWGGLDILVNAAGIAPPYELVDLPADRWRLTLEVNLTGYFLMARAAARIMIQQGMGGSIINISSKSGLEASKSNTPYNATKAGQLHMARGWALELGEEGIRVNSVAPGNVFEGSRIWNPEYIKACAAKYGIEPEEVIPYYVNKTALRREITGQDVADAVVFLCSDRARTITGQILVPDAGQVMVR